MDERKIDWGKVKTAVLVVSLIGNLLLGSAAYTYYGHAANYDNITAENQTLSDELDAAYNDLQVAEAENLDYEKTISDLSSQIQALNDEKSSLQTQVTQLTDSNKNLQSQVDQLKASNSSSSSSSGGSSAASSTPQSRTVYITNTGSKYHKSGCRYLKKSKIAISLSEAKSRGYTACSVCGG